MQECCIYSRTCKQSNFASMIKHTRATETNYIKVKLKQLVPIRRLRRYDISMRIAIVGVEE